MFSWRLGTIIHGGPLLAAIYYPGLTDLAQRPRGRKSPNWHFCRKSPGGKVGGGVGAQNTHTPRQLLTSLPSYLLSARMYNYNLLRANK